MSVTKRGSKFHYRFQYQGKGYCGVCEGCATKAQAEEFEKNLKAELGRVKAHRTVAALVESYRYELSGGTPIKIEEGYEKARRKPRKRGVSEGRDKVKATYWADFCAFLKANYPDVTSLQHVQKSHCEAYLMYLEENGRFITEREVTIKWPHKRAKKLLRRTSENTRRLAPATITVIATTCASVFRLLREDAGLLRNPWEDVELPGMHCQARDIFSEHELALIRDGIARDEFCRPLFIIAAATGLTEGDICTLRWSEVSLEQRVIHRTRRKTGVFMEIPVIDGLADYLATLPRDNEYVLPEHAALYLKRSSLVSRKVIAFLQSLGIQTAVEEEGRRRRSVKDLHSMRHVFCYYAGLAGIPLVTVQSIVGHLTPEMTRHYQSHVTLAAKREAAVKLPSLLQNFSSRGK